MLTVLDVERLARMAEAGNWLHPPLPRRRRAWRWYSATVLLLAAVGGVVIWRLP